MSSLRRRDAASASAAEQSPPLAPPIDDDHEPSEPDDLQPSEAQMPAEPTMDDGPQRFDDDAVQEQPQAHETAHDEADPPPLESDELQLDDPAADSSSVSLSASDDAADAASPPSSSSRVLYEVLFHAPHFQPDLDASLDDGLLSSSPLSDSSSSAADLDDVSEIEYLASMERRAAAASSVQQAARQQIHRVWWNCCRRRSAAVKEKERDEETTADAQAAAAAAAASAASASPDSASDSSSPSCLSNWPVLLSPNGDLLAIIRDRSVVLRGSNHDFAGAQMEFPVPAYAHAHTAYPTSLAGMLAATVPKAALAPGWTHPFSASHARPVAWSARSELIAMVTTHDEVAVYALTPLRLVHTLRIDARSPLESPPSSSALALPIAAARGSSAASAQFPAISSLVFREAPCPLTPRGYCPHLIVLCADGSVQHLHIPAVGMHNEGGMSTAPSSPYLSSNQNASAAQQMQPLSTFYPPHLPLAHTGRASPDDSMRASASSEQQLRQRGVPPSRSATDAPSATEVDAHAADSQSSAASHSASTSASSREYLTFLGVSALHARIGGAANVFGSASFDSRSQRLYVASISAGRDRTPQVSVWRVSDTESPFLFALSISPSVALAPPRPVMQRPGTLRRLLTFARMSVGATEIGGTAGDGQKHAQEEDEHRATFADVACSLRLSPDGSRITLLDQRGNLNIWLLRDAAEDDASSPSSSFSSPPQWTLLDSHRWRDGCPSLSNNGDGAEISPVLLCDVTWWSANLLLCAYTNGHLVLTPVNSPAMLTTRATASANPAFSAPSMHALHLSSGESLRRNLLGDRAEGVHGIPTLTRAIEARMQQQLPVAASSRRSAESLSGSPVLGPMPAPSSSSALAASGSVVSLPHRVFLLECERRFLRRRKLWSSVGAAEDDATNAEGAPAPPSASGDEGDDDPPILLRRTFRLLSLCESTPEQFLLSKVEARQYDEALGLARAYNLNTDLIFQARWRNAAVSAESVRSLLLPITDRWWVLSQLVDRLFEVDLGGDLDDAATVLIQCGLECTTPQRIKEIRLGHEREALESGRDYSVEGFEREQTKLCMYRLLFLHYSDRVHTLMTIHRCAAPSLSLSRLTYETFLECDLVSAALSLARDSQFLPLHLLFYFHQAELWHSRRQILAAIPDTADPREYAEILPMPGMSFAQFTAMAEGGGGNHAVEPAEGDASAAAPAALIGAVSLSSHFDPTHPAHPSNRAGRRDRDWIENVDLLQTMLQLCRQSAAADPSFAASLPFDFESLESKIACISLLEDSSSGDADLSAADVARFYTDRVSHMDSTSGRLNFAARLLGHAVDRLGVQGLDATRGMLSDLTTLVYTYELDFLSLHDYAPLSDFERLCLVMRGATPNTIEHDLRSKAKMFFERSDNSSGNQQEQQQESEDPFVLSPMTPPLLRRYLLHIASSRLDLIYAVVLASSPRRQQQPKQPSGGSDAVSASSSSLPPPLLRTHADLVSVALECCYESSANDPTPPDAATLELLSSIFECLPARSHSDSPRLSLLHRYLDELDNQLTAMEILSKYEQARPLHFFLTLPTDNSDAANTQELQRWGPHRAAREAQRQVDRKWATKHPSLKRSSAPPVRAETECLRLLESMVRSLIKHQKPASILPDEAWHALLRDMLELRLKVFPFLTPEQVHAIVLHGTLSRERWTLSRDLLRSVTSANPSLGESALMSLPAAERLVLDVAKEFLNAAPSLRSHGLAQAEACLELLPIQQDIDAQAAQQQQLQRGESTDSLASSSSDAPAVSLGLNHLSSPALTAEWQSEFELLAGLRQLEKMGVDALVPLEIRLAKDRQSKDAQEQLQQQQSKQGKEATMHDASAAPAPTVLDLLLRAKPRLYTQGSHLLEVLRSLGYASDSAQVAAHLQLASAALHHGDYRSSLKSMLQLMEQRPPTVAAQREQAAELCYHLSEFLQGGVAPTSSTGGGGGSTGLLAKPKLHLLAHSMWACDDAQQLNAFLQQYKFTSSMQQQAALTSQTTHAETRESKEEKHDDDEHTEKQPPTVASTAAAVPSVSAASVWEDDGDGTAQSEMEQLIAGAFGAGGDTQTQSQSRRARPDLQAIAQQAATTAATETEAESVPTTSEAESAVPVVSSVDAALLQLIDAACGVDSALALSYLLSLSSPLAAAPLLAAKLDDTSAAASSPASAGVAALPAFVSASPLLSRAQRLETVDVALRFFALTAIMQPHSPQILAALQEQAAANSKPANAAAAPTSPSAEGWTIPSTSALLDCSLETLQGHLDLLQHAYDSVGSSAAPPTLSLALHYSSLRAESKKSEFILQHCPNLDTVRFSSDAAYRIDSIRSMAAGNKQEDEALGNEIGATAATAATPSRASRDTSDSSSLSSARMLELALLLCKRYHLPVWDAYMERTRALFLRVRSVQRLRAEIELFKSAHLLSNPIATYTALIHTVWPALSGSDLPRLSYLLDLCVECFGAILHSFQATSSAFVTPAKKRGLVLYERNLARIQEHKELVDKLAGIQTVTIQQQQQQASATPSTPPRHSASLSSSSLDSLSASPLDYKLLISDPASCMCELRKLLTEHNLFLVARLTAKIQNMLARSDMERAGAQAEAAAAAATEENGSTAATAVAPLINGGLFPELKQSSGGSCANLSDVLWDVPPVPSPAAVASSDAESSSSSAAAVRIDSSLLFMLFLSHSLRRHLDALAAASAASGPLSAALTALPTVSAWFARFESLLKRLTVPHLAQLVSDLVLAGSRADQTPIVGFTIRPHKAELRNRLEVVQCALRILEQLPAWNATAASASSASAAGPMPPPGMLRSPSVDLDSASAPPVLSSEAKARLFDELTEAHMFLCILCAIFETGSLAGSSFEQLWSALVFTRGDSAQLHALMLRIIESVASPSSPLHPRDVVRMLDKIRVQKDSFTDWRSARRIQAQAAEEAMFEWKLFPILRRAVEDKINSGAMRFGPLESIMSSLPTLLDAAALTQLVAEAPACDLPALLSSFSSTLSEEQNIDLFQLILQMITAPPPEVETKQQLQDVRAQLRVILQMDWMADEQTAAGADRASPLHSTLREQLLGSAPLRQQLRQSLHIQLVLLQCELSQYQQENAAAESSSSSSSSSPVLTMFELTSQFVSPARRAAALESALQRWSGDAPVPTALAAVMILSSASDRPNNKKDAAASLAAWTAFVESLIARDEFDLLRTVLRTPLPVTASASVAAASSSSAASSRALWSLFDAACCTRFYRSLLSRSLASPQAELAAYKFALSCPVAASSLPLQAVQHLAQRCAMQSHSTMGVLQPDDELLSLLLSHASLSLLPLLPCPALFAPLARRLVSDFQAASPESRRSQVREGSLPHALALLVSEQMYAQAVALMAQAHSGSGASSGSGGGGWIGSAHRMHMQSIKSMLQQAKTVIQQQRDEHSGDADAAASLAASLDLYRAALSTLVMDELAS